jgi:Ni2+-binding GTPase involved in maturation of urease and hydrogenase
MPATIRMTTSMPMPTVMPITDRSATRLSRRRMAVAGDRGGSADDNDARRIAACGVPVVRIYTSTMCHLDAQMVADACRRLAPAPGTMVMVENIGNLVCPALFDLGGAARVVVASVTESDDKPAKYLYMFETADLVVLNKCDLLPYVPFDPERFEASLHDVNRDAGDRSCPGDARRRAAGVKRAGHRFPLRAAWAALRQPRGTGVLALRCPLSGGRHHRDHSPRVFFWHADGGAAWGATFSALEVVLPSSTCRASTRRPCTATPPSSVSTACWDSVSR